MLYVRSNNEALLCNVTVVNQEPHARLSSVRLYALQVVSEAYRGYARHEAKEQARRENPRSFHVKT